MQYLEYFGIIATTMIIFIYYLFCRNHCIIFILKEMLVFNINNSPISKDYFNSMAESISAKYKTLPILVKAIISLDYFIGLIYMLYHELPIGLNTPKNSKNFL